MHCSRWALPTWTCRRRRWRCGRRFTMPRPIAPASAEHGFREIKMYAFNYHKPASIEEAGRILGAADDASVLAGGMSLVPTLKQRLAAPSDLIDLNGVAGLDGI